MQNKLLVKLTAFLETIPRDWLLEGPAFVKYRTFIDLEELTPATRQVKEIKRSTFNEPLIRNIFNKLNNEGYWGIHKDITTWWPRKDTTFWVLGILADFGFTGKNEKIARACEYVFNKQHPSGAFGWSPPPTPGECFTGILLETLIKLGYYNDARVVNGLEWLVRRQRHDGGFWCKNTGQPGKPRENEPSCAYATLCAMGAMIHHPEYANSSAVGRSARFLLKCWDNRDRIKFAGHDSQIGKGWEKLKYPYTDYRILKYLDTLSLVPKITFDSRVKPMVNILINKADESGKFCPESIHKAWSAFDFGQKKTPSRWITILVYRIVKRLVTANQ